MTSREQGLFVVVPPYTVSISEAVQSLVDACGLEYHPGVATSGEIRQKEKQ